MVKIFPFTVNRTKKKHANLYICSSAIITQPAVWYTVEPLQSRHLWDHCCGLKCEGILNSGTFGTLPAGMVVCSWMVDDGTSLLLSNGEKG